MQIIYVIIIAILKLCCNNLLMPIAQYIVNSLKTWITYFCIQNI